MRYQSLDPIGHYFLRYAVPSRFGDVTDDERRRFGGVLESHYAIVDEAIGRAIARSGRTICCWSCPATAWSRSASASGCSSG